MTKDELLSLIQKLDQRGASEQEITTVVDSYRSEVSSPINHITDPQGRMLPPNHTHEEETTTTETTETETTETETPVEEPIITHPDKEGWIAATDRIFKQEGNAVNFLNEQYGVDPDDKTADFRFVEATVGADTVEVLTKGQQPGEGMSYNLSFNQAENNRQFNEIKTYVEQTQKRNPVGKITEKAENEITNLITTLGKETKYAEDQFFPSINIEENIQKSLNTILETNSSGWEVEEAQIGAEAIKLTSPGGVSKTFNIIATSATTDEDIASAAQQMIEFINLAPVKSDEHLEDKNTLRNELLTNYFTKEKITEITGKDFLQNVESPKQFVNALRDDIGKNRFFDKYDRTELLNLSDDDIYDIVKNTFNEKVSEEKNNVLDSFATDYRKRIENGEVINTETGDVLETYEDWRNWHVNQRINNLPDQDRKDLARVNLAIADLDENSETYETDLKKLIEKQKTYVDNLKEEENFDLYYDAASGSVIKIPESQGTWDEGENLEPDIDLLSNEIQNELDNSNEDVSHLDILKNRFDSNALVLGEIKALENKKYKFNVSEEFQEEFGYDPTIEVTWKQAVAMGMMDVLADGDAQQNITPVEQELFLEDWSSFLKNVEGSKTVDLEQLGFLEQLKQSKTVDGKVVGRDRTSWEMFNDLGSAYNLLGNLKRDQIVEQATLERMYLTNEDIISIEKKKGINYLKQASSSLIGILPGYEQQKLFPNWITEREVVDKYGELPTELGLPVTTEAENYVKRSLGEQIGEGLANSAGILVEFAFLNKATAAARTAKLFRKGTTSFDDMLNGWKASRYSNGALTVTTAQATQMAAKQNKSLAGWISANAGKEGWKNVGKNWKKYAAASYIVEPIIEGLKFKAIGGEFSTGAGFGLMGQILMPMLGTVRAYNINKTMPKGFDKTKIGNFVINNAPRLDRAYQLAFKSPLSFMTGSELGEISLGLTEDFLLGQEDFSDFMDEHYGHHSDWGKRMIANWFVGMGFGAFHKATYTGFKSLNGLKTAKAEALTGKGGNFVKKYTYQVQNKKTGKPEEFTRDKWNKLKNQNDYKVLKKPGGHWGIRKGITKEQFIKNQETAEAMDFQINRSTEASNLLDPFLGQGILQKKFLKGVKSIAPKGVETYIDRVTSKTKGPDGSKTYYKDKQAEILLLDKNGNSVSNWNSKSLAKIVAKMNVDLIEPGVIPHEVGHAGMQILFGTNARLKGSFMTKLGSITKKISSRGDITLFQELKDMGKWSKHEFENARINDWETFSYIAEFLAKPENYRAIKNAKGFSKLSDLIQNNVGKELKHNYNFKLEKDIVRFFGDYIEAVNKGHNSNKILKHLENVIDRSKTGETKMLRDAYGEMGIFVGTEAMASRNLSMEKTKLREENIRLAKERPKGWREEQKKIGDKIREINKLMEISESNQKNIETYKDRIGKQKEGVTDPLFERAVNALRKNNEGIINDFVNKNFKEVPGSALTKAEFKQYVEGIEFLKLLNTYKLESGVPLGAYLKQNLGFRLGNILRALKVDMAAEAKITSLDVLREKGFDVTAESSFEAKGKDPYQKKGIELVTELPVKQKAIDIISNKSKKLNVESLNYRNLKDLAPELTKEMFGKNNKEKANFIFDNFKTIYDALPLGSAKTTGRATGIENSILKDFYKKGKRTKFVETGEAAGLSIQEKIPMSKSEFLNKLGIKPGTRKINEVTGEMEGNVDISGMGRNIKTSTMPAIQNQIGKAITNQVVKQAFKNNADFMAQKNAETLLNQMSSGKSLALASKKLGIQRLVDQVNLFKEIQTPEFIKTLKNVTQDTKVKNKLATAFQQHFAKNELVDFKITNADLKIIGEQLNRKLKLEGLVAPRQALATRVGQTVFLPNETSAIELKHGYKPIGSITRSKDGLQKGQVLDTILAQELLKRKGKGSYETFLMDGTTSPGGIGGWKTMEAYLKGEPPTGNRSSLWRNVKMLNNMLSRLSDPKTTYKGITRAESNLVANKTALMKVLKFDAKNKKVFDLKAQKKLYEIGEKNKEVLKDVIEILNDLHMREKETGVTYEHVRSFVDVHSASMRGLIKKAASLAVLPHKMSPAELVKTFGKDWVLEHITPAKYVKNRIYDYILEKDPKKKKALKEALDLTLKNYNTTLIPKRLDVMVNKLYLDNLPPTHLPGMDVLMHRYYENPNPMPFDIALKNHVTGKVYDKNPGLTGKQVSEQGTALREYNNKILGPLAKGLNSKNLSSREIIKELERIDKAIEGGLITKKKKKGMSTFDFDDTVAKTKSKVITISPKGKKGYMTAEQYAKGYDKLAKEGYKFDFSEFNKVTKGKPGPLMQKLKNQIKKYGNENVYILTARPPQSAKAIQKYLKSEGINLKLKNITGLGNSTGQAKALWMLKKFGEGYNDMYFVDDALSNVKAVKKVLNRLDVKSNVQQALASKKLDLNKDFNKILEETTGVGVEKTFSKAKATLMGRDKWTKSLMTAGNQDFMGLMQNFAGRGKKGEAQLNFFRENLQKPFAKAYNNMNVAKQAITNDYKALSKQLPKVKKKLNKKIPNDVWTYDQAIRVHRWTEAGFKVPDISKTDIKKLNDIVKNDAELLAFSNKLGELSKQKDGYIKPTENWLAESVVSDLHNITMFKGRENYLTEFSANRKAIFGEWKNGKLEGPNMNKIEATQGKNFKEALEDMLWRMETGTNRPTGKNALVNAHMDFLNGAVGATMFFNTRSATLQLLSTFNFINWGDNNPLKAGKAFANQPRYWKDFAYIFNSDMLLQRRSGLKYNVSEAEIAQVAAQQGYSPKKMLAWFLKKGFLPTQIADSFAISAGGASFYRNRINTYKKQGLSEVEAKKKAWLDFQETAEVSQQSSRPDLISKNQAGPMGRTVLAWANTPMQYGRIKEKAVRNLINRRGDTKTHLSKLAYYGAIQSALFAGLQSALFAFALDEEDDMVDYDKYKNKDGTYKKNPETGLPYTEKQIYDLSRNPIVWRVANTMLDGELSGFGIPGKVVSTAKNTVMEFQKQEGKAYGTDHAYTMLQLFSYSPVLGSKARKFYSATQTWKYNEEEIKEMGLTLDNPGFLGAANVIEGITNIPAARALMKIDNLRNAADDENQWWQRVASFGGWSRWNLGIDNDELKEAKERVKIAKEYKKIEEKYKGKKSPVTGEDYSKQEIEKSVELFNLKKDDQVDMLLSLGLSSKEIKALKYEEDRVNKIMELQSKGKNRNKKKSKSLRITIP